MHIVRSRRSVAVLLLAVGALVVAALPAGGHPGFGSAATFGFQPNTAGGTGAPGNTTPYAPGTAQELYLRVPYEQGATTYTGTGGFNTTIRVDIVVPAGWTDAACDGSPKMNVNVAGTGPGGTNATNQPGGGVAGWTCTVVTENGHEVVRYTGPQLANGVAADQSAQWFYLTVTTPSPDTQTTYNGAAGSGTEGFVIDQYYASSADASPPAGSVRHWYPSADYPGVVPPGATLAPGDVAGGLARTVAGTSGAASITSDAGSLAGSTAVSWSPVLASTSPPAGVNFAYGRVSFSVSGLTNGQTVHVTITYPGEVTGYWKYQNGTWSEFAGAVVSGNTVTLTLVDGGAGDADGTANGTIVDPGAASTPEAVVPAPPAEPPVAAPVTVAPAFTG